MKLKSLFYKIYFSVIAVFAVALIGGLIFFRGWLSDYEAGQPEQVVNSFVEAQLKTGNIYSSRKEYNLKISEYETEEGFKSAINSLTSGKELGYSTSSAKPEGCDIAYSVKADGDRLLSVYLKKNGKKYAVSGIEFAPKIYKSCKITATSDAEISVNGISVKKSDRTDEKLPNIKSELLNDPEIINKQVIKLDGLLNPPKTVKATLNGKELKVENEGDNYNAVQDFPKKAEIGDFAGKAASACAAYMQNDGSFATVKKYVDSNTDLYKNIRTSLITFVLEHDGYKIKDLKVTDYHKYSDKLYSCRVRLTNELKRGTSVYNDNFDKYLYIRTDGTGYKVLDMQNTGE